MEDTKTIVVNNNEYISNNSLRTLLKGDTGFQGEPGTDGVDGKSAYEIWLELGNEGTEQDFLNSLQGRDGKDGIDGQNGKDGQKGADGINGQDGFSPLATITQTSEGATISIIDKNGTTSVEIKNGKDGTNGVDGKDGVNGADGKDGANGINGQDGQDGISATHSWNGTVLTITSASGTSSADLKGDKGDKGDTAEYDDTEIKQRISNAEDDIDNLETTVARHTTEIAEKQPIGDYALRSEIPNLDGYVKDLSYVHTDNNYTTAEKNKLANLNNYDDTEIIQEIIELNNSKQNIIDNSHKLSSDLVDDSNNGNKFVTTSEKQTWNSKYEKPSGGIPKTDLESAVQISLGKADTALQSHQDISGKEDKTNKTTTIDTSNPSNDKYPSESAIVSYVNDIIGNINTILDDINGEVI